MDTVKAFNTELSSLYEFKPPISRAKMKFLTRGAIRAVKFYEHVVQSVEKFILKCKPEYKIPGLYLIDSIVRQSRHQFGIDRDVFAPRFAKNIQQTFVNLYQCPREDKIKIVRVLNLWQNSHIFTADVIHPLFNLSDGNNPIYKELGALNQRNEHKILQKAPQNMPSLPPVMMPKLAIGTPTNLQEQLMTNQLLGIGSPFQGAGLIRMSLSNENSQGNSDNIIKKQAEILMSFGQKCNMMNQLPYMSDATIKQEDIMSIKMEDTYLVHQELCSNENDTSRDDRGNQTDTENGNGRSRDRRRTRSRDRESNSLPYADNEEKFENLEVKIENVDIAEQFIDETGVHDRRAYPVKREFNHVSDSGRKIVIKKFLSTQSIENQGREHVDSNMPNHYSVIMDTLEQQEHFSSNRKCNLSDDEKLLEKHISQNEDLSDHIAAVHLNIKQHECHFCEYSASRKRDLTSHVNSVHLNARKHNCHLCEYSANQKGHLRYHIDAVHLNMKKHKCHLCEYSANRKVYLKIHIDSVHLNSKGHKCDLCEYSTNRKGNLTSHVNSVHLKSKKYKCHFCGNSTTQKSNLMKHIDSVHLKMKKHKCHLCEYSANQKVNLKIHIDSVHFNLKQHKCHLCEYSTTEKSLVRKHVDSVHLNLKQHKCNFCDYAATQKVHLKQHLHSVHLNSRGQHCNLCEYSTNRKADLISHVNSVHLNSRKHNCHLCGYSANQKAHLKYHIDAVHLNVKQHECHLCEYSVYRKAYLKRHIDSVHSN